MGRACGAYGDDRGVHRVLVEKPEGKVSLGRPRRRWEDNIKIDLQKVGKSRGRPRTLNELKTAIIAYIRNISQADLQKVFANKIKWDKACIDACGHHFQHLL
jgi:hypothetical protein